MTHISWNFNYTILRLYYSKKHDALKHRVLLDFISLSYPIFKLFITHTDIVIVLQHNIKSRLNHLAVHICMIRRILVPDITFTIADAETTVSAAYLPVILYLVIAL